MGMAKGEARKTVQPTIPYSHGAGAAGARQVEVDKYLTVK